LLTSWWSSCPPKTLECVSVPCGLATTPKGNNNAPKKQESCCNKYYLMKTGLSNRQSISRPNHCSTQSQEIKTSLGLKSYSVTYLTCLSFSAQMKPSWFCLAFATISPSNE
jgi:hypothetical protein